MARYIDLDKVEFLKANGNKEFNHGVDCCINKLLKIEPADAIERSEYELIRRQLSQAFDRIAELDKLNGELHSKIDNAIKEIEQCKVYGHTDCARLVSLPQVLDILKRNIGE